MAPKAKAKTNGSRGLYGAYVFKDKDPAIDAFRTLVEDHFGRRVTTKDLTIIEASGGPTSSCMRAWLFGATLRPQNPTMEAAGRALGYERVWRHMRKNSK